MKTQKKIATVSMDSYRGRILEIDGNEFDIFELANEKWALENKMTLDEVEESDLVDDEEMRLFQNNLETDIMEKYGITHVDCPEESEKLITIKNYIKIGQ